MKFSKEYLKKEIMSEYKNGKGEDKTPHERVESKRKEVAEKIAVRKMKKKIVAKKKKGMR
jgi:hypothetical protein